MNWEWLKDEEDLSIRARFFRYWEVMKLISEQWKEKQQQQQKLYILAVGIWLYEMEKKVVKESTWSPTWQNGQYPYSFLSATTI